MQEIPGDVRRARRRHFRLQSPGFMCRKQLGTGNRPCLFSQPRGLFHRCLPALVGRVGSGWGARSSPAWQRTRCEIPEASECHGGWARPNALDRPSTEGWIRRQHCRGGGSGGREEEGGVTVFDFRFLMSFLSLCHLQTART